MYPGIASYGLLDVMRRVARTGEPERLPVRYYQDDLAAGQAKDVGIAPA